VVSRALRWLVRRDRRPDPLPDDAGPRVAPDVPMDRSRPAVVRPRPDHDQPPSRRGASASGAVTEDRELIVGQPAIRYAYPDVPALIPARPELVETAGRAGSTGSVQPVQPTGTARSAEAFGPVEAVPAAATEAELVRERQLVRQAISLVDDQERLVRDFYSLVFALGGPAVVGMFPTDLRRQRQEFGRTLVQWVTADDPASLAAHLDQLGADHRKFDVEPAHYAVAGEALVAAVRGRSGGLLTAAHEDALRGSYGRLATVMVSGALRRIAEPPYWQAEVVGHHRYKDDFAVVTLQPAAPYPYRAGQYTTVELASRPKLWRQMSIASAPRADNTFDLHVRAVPGGDVSTALVRHTQPGDRLRVGPPRGGALVVEPGTADALLCVAAGAGAAPIAAVVESVLTWRRPPTLYAYVGARTADDLYSVRYLTARTLGLPDVHIHGIVSDEPDFPGLRGRVESVAPGLAPWASLGVDVLVAGPTRMMDQTVTNLREAGVPADRIRFDQYEAVNP
jgi:NAD(P)H-flavin reductase/hemoglobin-like flavoprotein